MKISLKIKEIIFTLALFFIILNEYAFLYLQDSSSIILKIIKIISLLLLITGIFFARLSFNEILLGAILGSIYMVNRKGEFLLIYLFCINSKEVILNRIVKKYLVISLFFYLLIIFLGILDLTPIPEKIHYKIISGIKISRKELGFGNPNGPMYYLIPIIMSYIVIYYREWKVKNTIILLLINVVLYGVTYSRTGFLANLLILFIIFLTKLKKQAYMEKIYKYIYISIPLLFTLISILIGTIYSHNIKLNKALSGRPWLWNYYLNSNQYKLKLLGNMNDTPDFPLDNGYIYILSKAGVVIFMLIYLYYYNGLKISFSSKRKEIFVIIFYILMYGTFENVLTKIALNISLVVIYKIYTEKERTIL